MLGMKPISISLSPNTEHDDISLAFKLLVQPWRWKKGTERQKLEHVFAERLGVKHAFAFNSGRSSLLAILNALDLKEGDEVLLQAFTCNAVPNPVLWARLKPVYVDCSKEDFNIDVQDLQKKITMRSKAVIVQHTFGMPADMEKIMALCRKHNLLLIEDCAHALGATFQGKQVGTFGDAAFFSFSRDKVISCVYGGMAVTSNDEIAARIKAFHRQVENPSFFWVFQQLLHPLLMNWIILPTYSIFGKYLLIFLQQAHILSKAVHWKEKRGQKPGYFPRVLPEALAILAIYQLGKLEKFNNHRKDLAALYAAVFKRSSFQLPQEFPDRQPMFLRFVLQHPKAHEIIRRCWSHNFLIGDWYTTPIAPGDTKLEKIGYQKGSCPVAERLAKTTLNLPTHINISQREAKTVINFLLQDIGVCL